MAVAYLRTSKVAASRCTSTISLCLGGARGNAGGLGGRGASTGPTIKTPHTLADVPTPRVRAGTTTRAASTAPAEKVGALEDTDPDFADTQIGTHAPDAARWPNTMREAPFVFAVIAAGSNGSANLSCTHSPSTPFVLTPRRYEPVIGLYDMEDVHILGLS